MYLIVLFASQKGEYIKVLKVVLMSILDKLFGSDASDATVQTGCNILKVHTYVHTYIRMWLCFSVAAIIAIYDISR